MNEEAPPSLAPALRPGLCSVTFRQLDPGEVIDVAAGAGLDGIEWGADVHLPPGDERAAAAVAARCAAAGLACPSYGSYLVAGRDGPTAAAPVLASAVALGVDTVRVWAGTKGAADAAPSDRAAVAADLHRWAVAAEELGLTLALEFHRDTLTDTAPSCLELLEAAGAPPVFTYWQPRDGDAGTADRAELSAVSHRLAHVHVFWWRSFLERFPLEQGESFWVPALWTAATATTSFPHQRWAHLEFVPGDDPTRLPTDVAALRSWLA